jgi:hypothetical protein
MSNTENSDFFQDAYSENGYEHGKDQYDNPFVENPQHNALFTLTRYQCTIDELIHIISVPDNVTSGTLKRLFDTVEDINKGLEQCRQYVKLIGERSDNLCGTIKVMWNAVPEIRTQIGGHDDVNKTKEWGKNENSKCMYYRMYNYSTYEFKLHDVCSMFANLIITKAKHSPTLFIQFIIL